MDARDEQIQWLRVAVNCLQRDVPALSHGVQVRDRRIRELEHDKQRLEQQLAELRPPPTSPPSSPPTHDDDTPGPTTGAGGPPPFVKPPVPRRRRRKRPGREDGHEAALRPPPPKVDRTVRVPLPRSRRHGKCCCPHCRTRLTKFRRHRRLVEDLVPARVRVTCYRTRSGWCRHCRRRGGRVIRRLLGGHFGGTLVSDFYAAYDTVNCEQQKCLTHLLRELRETAARSPPFAAGRFHRRCKRLAKDLLEHKGRWDELDDPTYERLAHRLEQRLAELAAAHVRDRDPDARRLAQRLTKYRERLTTFLWDRPV